ncbi:MAG: 30S ribosomal protein S1 [Chloroflexi bacterium]|nr:30S ribosomal protein S1 [Chloroflexota bacterium]
METEVIEKELEDQVVEDQENDENDENPAWFQDFIDHHDFESPKSGDILEGEILDIGTNSILLDVGLKRDAIVTSQDLDKVNEEILEELEVGDKVHVSVLRTPVGDDDLLVSLNRGIAYKNWLKAEEYLEDGELLNLEIIEQNKGGLLVTFENLRGFVPNSHIPALRRGASHKKMEEIKAEMIGEVLPLKAIEVNRKQRRLVFSARVAQKEQRRRRLEELEAGDIIKSRVVNVVDFGLFVDLQGVDGLVHKSEIAWDRVYNPSKYFSVGDAIEVKVVDVDVEKERVSLSRKALLSNPWDALREKYDDGDLIEGKVVSVLDFGAFVELPEGLQGLVHVSELGYANMSDPKSIVREGDNVLVRVMSIDPGRERISLSMRRVPVSEQLSWMMKEEIGDEEAEEVEEPSPEAEAVEESAPEAGEVEETEKAEVVEESATEADDVEESEETEEEVEEIEEPSAEAEADEEPAPEADDVEESEESEEEAEEVEEPSAEAEPVDEPAPEAEEVEESEEPEDEAEDVEEPSAEPEAVEEPAPETEEVEESEEPEEEVEEVEEPSAEAEEIEDVEDGLLNINTAETSSLTELPGIGPALAERIIENRPYGAIEELTDVKGIGAKALEDLKELITVD